ncbi:hypothetical protein GGI42DRAFT_157154 [Trichoderma sp. SZMC 28013]
MHLLLRAGGSGPIGWMRVLAWAWPYWLAIAFDAQDNMQIQSNGGEAGRTGSDEEGRGGSGFSCQCLLLLLRPTERDNISCSNATINSPRCLLRWKPSLSSFRLLFSDSACYPATWTPPPPSGDGKPSMSQRTIHSLAEPSTCWLRFANAGRDKIARHLQSPPA